MKKIIRTLSLSLVLAVMMGICVYAVEVDEPSSTDEDSIMTAEFVAEADCSVISDSNGEPVILLTKEKELPSCKLNERQHVKTTVAILPSSEQEKEEILNRISVTRGSGSQTEDGWFYGSSVYLSSTAYYTRSTINNQDHVGIDRVTIQCRVNSGTQITAMSLLMGQIGATPPGYPPATNQSKTFNALTTRTFYAPSNWIPVILTGDVGAHVTATATRNGGSSTFTLYNSLI